MDIPARHHRVEIGLRPPPVGRAEPVDTVVRHRHRHDPRLAEQLHQPVDRHRPLVLEGAHLRQVVAQQPEVPGHPLVPGEDHHAPPDDPTQLGDARAEIGPVVHGQQRHRRVHRAVADR
jgi:hypothetical protein